MRKFADFMIKWRVIICVFALVLTGICGALIRNVNINTDLTKYLADDSQMNEGMKLMASEVEETQQNNVIRVMFKGLDNKRKDKIVEELSEIKNVEAVNYDPESKEYNKGDYTLFKVETTYEFESTEEVAIRKTIESKYAKDNVVVKNGTAQSAVLKTVILIAVGIALIVILFAMAHSWIEPFLYALVIGLAVVMNMGTNAFLGSVSQITNLLVIILQVVFTLDYSIMLMNRYRDERDVTGDKVEAMSGAFAKAFSSVTGSSIATVVAVIMLAFMSFKLGADMGIVFAKGILCSGFCVLAVLPAIIAGCDKALLFTSKPALPMPTKLMGVMSNKLRYVMPAVLIAVFIVAFYVQDNTGITFTSSTEDEISKVIPNTNAIVAMYDNNDADKVDGLAKQLQSDENVVGVMSFPNTLGKENTAEEMSEMVKQYTAGSNLSIDASILNILYYDYYKKGELPTMTVNEFVNFLADDVATNETFAGQIDKSMIKQIDTLKKYADKKELTKKMNAGELAKFLGMKEGDIKSLFVLYYAQYGGADTGSLTLPKFVDFLSNDVMTNKTYGSMFDKGTKEKVELLKTYTNINKMTRKSSPKEIAKILGMDSETVKLLYVYYYSKDKGYTPKSMDLPTFVEFLTKKVMTNKAFSSYFDKETAAQFGTVTTFTDKKKINAKLHSEEMAKILGIDQSMVDLIYVFYHGTQNVGSTTLTLPQFTNFLVNKILPNKMLSGSFDNATRAKLTQMNQMLNLAVSGQQLGTAQLAAVLGVPEAQVHALLQVYAATTGKQTASLAEFMNFLVNIVFKHPEYGAAFTPAMKQTVTQMYQLIGLSVSGTKLGIDQISSIFGIPKEQVTQLFVLYTGMNMKNKKMSPVEIVNYLIEAKKQGGPVGSAIDKETVAKLTMAQNIMNLTLSGKKFTYAEIAKMFSIDAATVKMLFTLHDSYGDTASWKLSMETIVDFLLKNSKMFSSMMDASTLDSLKLAQQLIKGSIKGTKYSVKDMSALLGLDKSTLNQVYLLYISQYGDTSKWQMTMQELMNYLVEDVLTNKSLASMLGDMGDTVKTAKIIIDAVVSEKSYKSEELFELVGSLAKGLDKNIIDLLYLYYGSVKNSDPKWTMSVNTLFGHLANNVVNDKKFDAFLDDSFKKNISAMKIQLDAGIKQLVGKNYSLMLITTLYPSESVQTHQFVGRVDKLMANEFVGEHYLMGASVMTYEMEKVFKQEMMFITLVAAIAIFIVVLMTFRSAIIPTIIVLMIHCGIFVVVSATGITGSSINFMAYVLAQCVVTGITLNYSIMFTKNYIDYRKECVVEDALSYAFKGTLNAVLTSGLIMAIVAGILAIGYKDPTMAPMCGALAIGAITTIVLAICILPSVVAVCDKLIYHPKEHVHHDAVESYQHS